jgi:cell division septation protein DedD
MVLRIADTGGISMTYKDREVQPELFGKINKKQKQNLLNKNIFCSHYNSAISVSLDTLIVIIIGVLMVNLTAFVLGIEKGKVIAKSESSKVIAIEPDSNAAEPLLQKKITVVPAAAEEEQKTIEINPAEEKTVAENSANPSAGYIIQLVTYSSDSFAHSEVDRLSAQGLDGHVLKSGEYYIVYAGTYNSKIKANEKLASYKQRYKDCYVRLLKKS